MCSGRLHATEMDDLRLGNYRIQIQLSSGDGLRLVGADESRDHIAIFECHEAVRRGPSVLRRLGGYFDRQLPEDSGSNFEVGHTSPAGGPAHHAVEILPNGYFDRGHSQADARRGGGIRCRWVGKACDGGGRWGCGAL
jgi:hypothetical protein